MEKLIRSNGNYKSLLCYKKANYYCPLNFKDSKNVWLER